MVAAGVTPMRAMLPGFQEAGVDVVLVSPVRTPAEAAFGIEFAAAAAAGGVRIIYTVTGVQAVLSVELHETDERLKGILFAEERVRELHALWTVQQEMMRDTRCVHSQVPRRRRGYQQQQSHCRAASHGCRAASASRCLLPQCPTSRNAR